MHNYSFSYSTVRKMIYKCVFDVTRYGVNLSLIVISHLIMFHIFNKIDNYEISVYIFHLMVL